MKSLILGAILTAAALLLSSCSMVGSRLAMLNLSTDQEIIIARFEQIMEVIENRDADAFKEMFSEEALSDAEELDEAIVYLFDTFSNRIDSWDGGLPATSENWNHGEHDQSISSHFNVYVESEQYSFNILERSIDTENPEKVGLFSLNVKDDQERGRGTYSAGIQIAIGDRIIPEPPEEEDLFANEESFVLYDLTVIVPAGLEREVYVGKEESVSVYLKSDDDTLGSELCIAPTRSNWNGTDGAAALETDLDGAPILTAQSVISQYMVEPEVTAVYGTGKLTIDGKSAAYIEVELITGTDPAFVLKAQLASVISDGVAYDFLYSASPECYDKYLAAAQGIIDSAQFKAENPVKEIAFRDISMSYRENDVVATVSDEKVYLYYRRYNDNVPHFYAMHDDSVLYTDELLDNPIQLESLIQIWAYNVVDQRFKESMQLQEVLREDIEINGKRTVHVVFLNQWHNTNDSIELFLFIHNYDLYALYGKVEHGYEDALTSFIQPIIDSIGFDETMVTPPKNRPVPYLVS